jgi:flagellar biosynthesis protein FlhG
LFLLSNQGIVVSAPAVTAVLNAYVFLKNTVFRLMYSSFDKNSPARAYLEKIRKESSGGHHKLYIPKMLPEIKKVDPDSYEKFMERLTTLRPRLIMNMVDEPKNADVAMKIRRSCEEYLDLKIEHMGIIYRDIIQDTALASRLPITLYKPQSILSQAIYRIAEKIMQTPEDSFVLDDEQIDDSFQEAEMEAEVDFDSKMEYVEDLLHSGAMNKGDLIETIKSQQFEISKLRKENNFIKLKLTQALQQGFKV